MPARRTNKQVVALFIQKVFVEHDFNVLDDLMRDDYIQHNPDVVQGKKGFIDFFTATFKAIPDYKYAINKLVSEGDIVMAYCRNTGTHTGGPWLEKPPTGNRLDFHEVDIFRVQDGKIAEHWDVADTFILFKQVGIIERLMAHPSPPGNVSAALSEAPPPLKR
jgi:predicted SnoaL-like aldol condensation-catalyzing enzyme